MTIQHLTGMFHVQDFSAASRKVVKSRRSLEQLFPGFEPRADFKLSGADYPCSMLTCQAQNRNNCINKVL
jgi:hypothetical protein